MLSARSCASCKRWVDAEVPGPSLLPAESGSRRSVHDTISSSSSFASACVAIIGGSSGSWAVGRSHTKPQRRAFEAQLQALEGPLQQSGGPFLAGAAVSLADFILWPFLERCKMILPEFQGYKVEDHAGQAVVAWMTAMQELHSVKMAAPDERAFLSAVRTHMRLDFFDFHSYDAASTHPHLA
ncbi:hypothetical protein WJX73_009562 [Symbiochloris irregularis]|uniref:GST C-terminal domain-containing protein n=1 Tax=Symbiochloris irregularis TaxID=706552 RepID=A0AAW1NZ53_9CHLO